LSSSPWITKRATVAPDIRCVQQRAARDLHRASSPPLTATRSVRLEPHAWKRAAKRPALRHARAPPKGAAIPMYRHTGRKTQPYLVQALHRTRGKCLPRRNQHSRSRFCPPSLQGAHSRSWKAFHCPWKAPPRSHLRARRTEVALHLKTLTRASPLRRTRGHGLLRQPNCAQAAPDCGRSYASSRRSCSRTAAASSKAFVTKFANSRRSW